MKAILFTLLCLFAIFFCNAQKDTVYSFAFGGDVKITIDVPLETVSKHTILIFYALPNGNTTAQTMGKKMKEGVDWHHDIQHIKAQTVFLRQELKHKNIIVAYLENNLKSWPAWKQKHVNFPGEIKKIVDTIAGLFQSPVIYLNGHSGGGSFIFGYFKSIKEIPGKIKRISFIDSNYGYDSSYSEQLMQWVLKKKNYLTIFAYNDSVALYNGKPVVSATGGTWYRSHLMLKQLGEKFSFTSAISDSMIIYKSSNGRIRFFFKTNPEQKIFHTQQVELNGFIHSVLCGTKKDSKQYQYYGKRVYESLIEE